MTHLSAWAQAFLGWLACFGGTLAVLLFWAAIDWKIRVMRDDRERDE